MYSGLFSSVLSFCSLDTKTSGTEFFATVGADQGDVDGLLGEPGEGHERQLEGVPATSHDRPVESVTSQGPGVRTGYSSGFVTHMGAYTVQKCRKCRANLGHAISGPTKTITLLYLGDVPGLPSASTNLMRSKGMA